MRSLFYFELKSLFKQKRSWIIMCILIILGINLIIDFNNKAYDINKYSLQSINSDSLRYKAKLAELNLAIRNGKIYNKQIDISSAIEYKKTLELFIESLEKTKIYIVDENWEGFHNERLFQEYWIVSNLLFDFTQLKNKKLIEESTQIYKLHSEVKERLRYSDLVFYKDNTFTNVSKDFRNLYKTNLLYFYSIVQSKIFTSPVNRYTISGTTFIYHFFSQYWFYIFILQIIFQFDRVYYDCLNGINKIKGTLPYKRIQIIINELLVSTVSTIVVILIPLVIMSLLLFFYDGVNHLNIPILINPMSWNSFSGVENNIKYDFLRLGFNYRIGIGYNSSYPKGFDEINPILNFIKLKYFYGVTFLLFIFNVTFLSSIIIFLTRIIKYRIPALVFILTIFGFGNYLALFYPNTIISKMNPFAGFDMIQLNGGSSSVTLLNIVLILILSITIIISFTIYYSCLNKRRLMLKET